MQRTRGVAGEAGRVGCADAGGFANYKSAYCTKGPMRRTRGDVGEAGGVQGAGAGLLAQAGVDFAQLLVQSLQLVLALPRRHTCARIFASIPLLPSLVKDDFRYVAAALSSSFLQCCAVCPAASKASCKQPLVLVLPHHHACRAQIKQIAARLQVWQEGPAVWLFTTAWQLGQHAPGKEMIHTAVHMPIWSLVDNPLCASAHRRPKRR